MGKKEILKPKDRQKVYDNPLCNLNLSAYINPKPKKTKEKEDSDTYKKLEKEYRLLMEKKIKKEHRAFRVIYKEHPDLLVVCFAKSRASAKWKSAKYFKSTFHPFFAKWQDADTKMLEGLAYRIPELDEWGLKGEKVPIPDLLHALDITLPCSVCGRHHFNYSDYENRECFIVEGEGDLNPFTKGYILCYECYRKYIK